MLAYVYLGLLFAAAVPLHRRLLSGEGLRGWAGYFFTLGLLIFGATWCSFAVYAVAGWGPAHQVATFAPPLLVLAWGRRAQTVMAGGGGDSSVREPLSEKVCFGVLFVLLVSRAMLGIFRFEDGNVWVNFNYVDTAFHLSVANAFLVSSTFPPVDLDLAPTTLRYHFMADFLVAQLANMGPRALDMMWTMNVVSSAALAGALWCAFRSWLRTSPGWVLLAVLYFLGAALLLPNLVHYLVFAPPFYRPEDVFTGVLSYPYFNFEYALGSMLDPQRGLVFAFPALLLVLLVACGPAKARPGDGGRAGARRELAAFWTVCLLPLAHAFGFVVAAVALIPALLKARRSFIPRWFLWTPALAAGLLQLGYLFFQESEVHPDFSGWDAARHIPSEDFSAVTPDWLRRPVFWLFANGDFLLWGGLSLALVLAAAPFARGANPLRPAWRAVLRLSPLLGVGMLAFVTINFYRFSYAWGDSNKFVIFLNLGLTLVVFRTLASLARTRVRPAALALAAMLGLVALTMPMYELARDAWFEKPGRLLLFHRHEIAAANWLKANRHGDEAVLTAARRIFHFVTPLAAAPTRSGIYGDTNPNRRPGVVSAIRAVYEHYDLERLRELNVRYVCVSRAERKLLAVHPNWEKRRRSDRALVFRSGAEDEFENVLLFDAERLSADP